MYLIIVFTYLIYSVTFIYFIEERALLPCSLKKKKKSHLDYLTLTPLQGRREAL